MSRPHLLTMPEPTREWLEDQDELDPTDGAHPSLELHSPQQAEVERVWKTYWLPLLKEGGIPRLKGELYDAHFLVNEARQVYRHVTGGLCDDLCASAEGVIAMAEKRVERREQALRERIAELEAELKHLRSRS